MTNSYYLNSSSSSSSSYPSKNINQMHHSNSKIGPYPPSIYPTSMDSSAYYNKNMIQPPLPQHPPPSQLHYYSYPYPHGPPTSFHHPSIDPSSQYYLSHTPSYSPPPPFPSFPASSSSSSLFPSNSYPNINRPPPNGYCCRVCKIPGHWIQYCPQKKNGKNVKSKESIEQEEGEVMEEEKYAKASSYTCSPCQKTFHMESQYKAHLITHQKCEFENCTFSASKKVVTTHYAKVHGQYSGEGYKEIDIEGQKFTVLVGDSEKDIEQWRAERRKAWPSKETIEKKKQDLNQRMEAGDLLPCGSQSKTKNKGKNKPKNKKKGKICKFQIRGECKRKEQCPYEHNLKLFPCKKWMKSGECDQGDQCSFSHEMKPEHENMNPNTTKEKFFDHSSKKRPFSSLQSQTSPQKKKGKKQIKSIQSQPSLLTKLLESEHEEEKRWILQCFRYFRQNQFQLPKTKTQIAKFLQSQIEKKEGTSEITKTTTTDTQIILKMVQDSQREIEQLITTNEPSEQEKKSINEPLGMVNYNNLVNPRM